MKYLPSLLLTCGAVLGASFAEAATFRVDHPGALEVTDATFAPEDMSSDPSAILVWQDAHGATVTVTNANFTSFIPSGILPDSLSDQTANSGPSRDLSDVINVVPGNLLLD